MSLKNSGNILSIKNILLIISSVEMIAGILSDSFSIAVLGLFSVMYFYNFSFSGKFKNKFVEIFVKILIAVLILFLGLISFFETVQTTGYYNNIPQLWIFPVASALFFVRLGLKIQFGDAKDGKMIFPEFLIFLYLLAGVCILISYFFEFYFEPVFAVALAACEIHLFFKNIKGIME